MTSRRRGFSGPWRGHYSSSLEGSNRASCIVRWPGKVTPGQVSNEIVHLGDLFTTLVTAGGGTVPDDRITDGMDMSDFLLGNGEESGRDTILYFMGNRLQSAKWRQWKVHLFRQVDFPHAWVLHPIAAAAEAFLKTLAAEPPIKAGTPDPYTPPKPGELLPQQHIQLGPIIQNGSRL